MCNYPTRASVASVAHRQACSRCCDGEDRYHDCCSEYRQLSGGREHESHDVPMSIGRRLNTDETDQRRKLFGFSQFTSAAAGIYDSAAVEIEKKKPTSCSGGWLEWESCSAICSDQSGTKDRYYEISVQADEWGLHCHSLSCLKIASCQHGEKQTESCSGAHGPEHPDCPNTPPPPRVPTLGRCNSTAV
jgi:hypothetical protein